MPDSGSDNSRHNWPIPSVQALIVAIGMAITLCGVWYVATRSATDQIAFENAMKYQATTSAQLAELNIKVTRLLYYYCTSAGPQKCSPDGVPK